MQQTYGLAFETECVLTTTCLLGLFLSSGCICRLTKEPYTNKKQPSADRGPYPQNPRISSADGEAPRPLVVCKVSDCDGIFDVYICEKRAFVVDPEVKYPMLIG